MEHDGCAGCLYEYGIKEGELCEFCNRNYRDMYKKATRADRIRDMDAYALASAIIKYQMDEKLKFCKNLKECEDDLEKNKEIPTEKCKTCLVDWLRESEG